MNFLLFDWLEVLHLAFNLVVADHDFDPICLLQKEWEIIKLDIIDALDECNLGLGSNACKVFE